MGIRTWDRRGTKTKLKNFTENFLLTNQKPKSCQDQQLVRPMSEVAVDPQHQPLPGPGVAVELSDKGRQLQELPEQSQPEPEAPVPEECGDSIPMILLELKLAQFPFW